MEGPITDEARSITDEARSALLRAAVTRVSSDEMRTALLSAVDLAPPKAAAGALNALRRNRDPAAAVGRPAYRSALPYVAAAVADPCLARTIEELGDASDDPSREQLLAALDKVRDEFSNVTIAVMLASVAGADMPASDLCFEVLLADDRYGIAEPSTVEAGSGSPPSKDADAARSTRANGDHPGRPAHDTPPEQREARRERKRHHAEERRHRAEVARQAEEQARRVRKEGRAARAKAAGSGDGPARPSSPRRTPRLTRRALLTPAEAEEFDRDDPWVTGVVFAWVPFDAVDAGEPTLEGKARRCVVVAGSPNHLLVRPGYSEGGLKARDWRSHPLRHWRRAGFDQPTWIDAVAVRVPRAQIHAPVGWIDPDDWNALW